MKVEPVERLKDVYNLLRTSLMNAKYYSAEVNWLTRINLAFEIVLGLGATGTGVAGWALWKMPEYKNLWTLIAGASAMISIIKPIFDIGGKIKLKTELWQGYQSNFLSLQRLCSDIRFNKSIDESMLQRFASIQDRHEKLESMTPNAPNVRLLKKCQERVNEEIPSATLWMPTG